MFRELSNWTCPYCCEFRQHILVTHEKKEEKIYTKENGIKIKNVLNDTFDPFKNIKTKYNFFLLYIQFFFEVDISLIWNILRAFRMSSDIDYKKVKDNQPIRTMRWLTVGTKNILQKYLYPDGLKRKQKK